MSAPRPSQQAKQIAVSTREDEARRRTADACLLSEAGRWTIQMQITRMIAQAEARTAKEKSVTLP